MRHPEGYRSFRLHEQGTCGQHCRASLSEVRIVSFLHVQPLAPVCKGAAGTWKMRSRHSSDMPTAVDPIRRRWLPRCTPSSRRCSTFFGPFSEPARFMSLPGALAPYLPRSFPAFFCKFGVRLSWLPVFVSASKTSRLELGDTWFIVLTGSLFWQFGGPQKMLDLAAMMLQKARRTAHLQRKQLV